MSRGFSHALPVRHAAPSAARPTMHTDSNSNPDSDPDSDPTMNIIMDSLHFD